MNPRLALSSRTLRRLLFAALVSLGACASLPGAHGFTTSTSSPVASSPSDGEVPMRSGASTTEADQPADEREPATDGGFATTHAVPGASASWQDQPETEAHRGDNGMVSMPGPVPIGDTLPSCDAGRNHCLHRNTWFVSDLSDAVSMAHLAFRFDGRFYTWRNAEELRDYSGYNAYQTAPATADNAHAGDVIALYAGDEPGAPPDAAGHARTDAYWRIGKIASIDAAAGTFRFARGKAHPLAIARVAIASVPMR